MGQCVSHEKPLVLRPAVMAPAQNSSFSDGASQDNHSHQFSELMASDPQTPLDVTKLGDKVDYFDGVKKSGVRKSFRKSSIASLLPKVKGSLGRPKAERDNHLSAAFNMTFNKFDVVMLDINQASEEELMTLTGINRTIAQQIVEHRNAIGAFKKVEDLALVSGVGAAKLSIIKPEICIGKKVPSSSASVITANASVSSLNGNAETASISSSPKQERKIRRRREPVSINTGTMFQLMTVDGITQELAAHILHHREKKGPFKTLYDLRKVAGFNSRLVSALGPYLTTEANPVPYLNQTNGPKPVQNGHVPSHRRTASLPSGPLTNAEGFIRPASPVSSTPTRPVYPSISEFTSLLQTASVSDAEECTQSKEELSPCENALRILSWNLDGLSVEKARNPGVINVISRLLLRYHISVAVIQGVVDPAALQELCQDVNKQDGLRELEQPYTCTNAENGVGFLHRVPLQVNSSSATAAGGVTLSLATIEHGNAGIALVACSLTKNTTNISASLVPQLVKAVMDLSSTERIVCLADIFQNDHALYVEEFQNLGYRPTINKEESTSYVRGTNSIHSNILVSRYAQKALTGQWGIIRNGLTHILIPNGWSWNGPASLYCPIWVELKPDDDEGE